MIVSMLISLGLTCFCWLCVLPGLDACKRKRFREREINWYLSHVTDLFLREQVPLGFRLRGHS